MKEEYITPIPEQPEETPAASDTVRVVDIHFRSGGKVYYFDPRDLELQNGQHVIMDTARGPEYGICASGVHEVPKRDIVPPLRPVLRLATAADEKTVAENREKEKRAFEVCQKKIAEHGLDMQLVSAECAFDGSKILFFFTADGRVDFRELVKNLASIFRTRIELRQIGVRDKAKMVGGLGICGRPFCCSEFLDDFQPVSIKMAKVQNLSLNPTKISGTCGRLMCCLKYEQEAYEDLISTSPKQDSFVDTPDGRGTITEVNLLRQSVKVRMEKQPETIGCYKNCDICVLRSGKARKNDPPIPEDLAPISGGAVKKSRFVEEDSFPVLEDVLIKTAMPEPEEEPPKDTGSKKRSRNRNRGKKNTESAPQTPAFKETEAVAAQLDAAKRKRKARAPFPENPGGDTGKREGKQENRSENKPRPEGKAGNKNYHHRRRHRSNKARSGGEAPKTAE